MNGNALQKSESEREQSQCAEPPTLDVWLSRIRFRAVDHAYAPQTTTEDEHL